MNGDREAPFNSPEGGRKDASSRYPCRTAGICSNLTSSGANSAAKTDRTHHKMQDTTHCPKGNRVTRRIWLTSRNREGIAGILCLKELGVGSRKLEVSVIARSCSETETNEAIFNRLRRYARNDEHPGSSIQRQSFIIGNSGARVRDPIHVSNPMKPIRIQHE